MTSLALWVPLLWLLIIASRPISFWFGEGILVESVDYYLEGSPLDRSVYFLFILTGFGILAGRELNWGRIFTSNRWLFVFFLYCGVSVIWSDYPFVGFKRWIKDVGNVIMVLILLSEKDPVRATRSMLARFTYLVVPFSVLFIKYYSDLGKYYTKSWDTAYSGVATEKNALGCLALVSGLFLLWDLVEMRAGQKRKLDRGDLVTRGILLVMVFWLLDKAKSETSLVSLLFGSLIILMMQFPVAKRQVGYLGTYSLVIGSVIVLLFSVSSLSEVFVGTLGRDLTLTGRTVLWAQLLSEPINPLLGTGYQSFWLGLRAERYWEAWSFRPNQAHNGYLETYLNGGLVGVFLLLAMVASGGRRVKKGLLLEGGYWILCLEFLLVSLMVNWTEAMFSNMSPAWFILLIACVSPVRSSGSMSERIAENDTGGRDGTLHRTESPQDRRLRGDYWMARLVGGWGGEPTTTQIERPSCLALAGSVLTSGLKSAPIEGQAQVPKNDGLADR